MKLKTLYIWVCPFCACQWLESFSNSYSGDCPYCNKTFEVDNDGK